MLKGHIVDHEVQRHGHGVPDQFQLLAWVAVGEDIANQRVVARECTNVQPEHAGVGGFTVRPLTAVLLDQPLQPIEGGQPDQRQQISVVFQVAQRVEPAILHHLLPVSQLREQMNEYVGDGNATGRG